MTSNSLKKPQIQPIKSAKPIIKVPQKVPPVIKTPPKKIQKPQPLASDLGLIPTKEQLQHFKDIKKHNF